jgi:G3E family GTPase
LMSDRDVAEGHAIDTMVTLVDAQHGEVTLERHPEARRQVALADRMLLSKTDLVGRSEVLRGRLAVLNPGAALLCAVAGEVAPEVMFGGTGTEARLARLATLGDGSTRSPFMAAAHSDGVETFSLVREAPVPALALTLWLEALVEHCGERLLRVKGLVDVAEMPRRPALIHGVRHVFSVPEWLDRWPSADRRTRVVFIGEGVPRHFPARLLEAIEGEVVDETRRQTWN